MQVQHGEPTQPWSMDDMRSTKLDGARRAWETYASVGQSPRSGAVGDPKVRVEQHASLQKGALGQGLSQLSGTKFI